MYKTKYFYGSHCQFLIHLTCKRCNADVHFHQGANGSASNIRVKNVLNILNMLQVSGSSDYDIMNVILTTCLKDKNASHPRLDTFIKHTYNIHVYCT